MDLDTGLMHELDNASCEFKYRDSIFKSRLKNKAFITSVTLRLTKGSHDLNLSYGAITSTLAESGILNPEIRDVFNAVVDIRRNKLPDPALLGNAGSFFKNPVVPNLVYDQLAVTYPEIPRYEVDQQHVKLAAGWLIEKAGWKGKKLGAVSTYEKQALVIVNHGQATGLDIYNYAQLVKGAVFAKFGVILEEEVNLIK
jgi:UDP-N-acetylmuramate dehydrogenase